MMRIVRTIGLAVGLAVMAGGLYVLFVGAAAPAVVFTLEGAVIVAGVVFERANYKPLEPRPLGPGWTRTPERFIDDETGKAVTVYVQPATGERKYVKE
jgi:hypothetical protein